jgi:2-haloacid dehalogenase
MKPAAVVFDAYGTLFDISSVATACAELTDDPQALISLWRAKQLEYSFLRSLMGPAAYVDFWRITAAALDYAAERLCVLMSEGDRNRALQAWLEVKPYPEVESVVSGLKRKSIECAILSNGSPSMLQAALSHSGLANSFDVVLSADSVRVFKPDRRVYQLAVDALTIPMQELLFVSSNGWDAAGAKAFGFPVAWVNRADAPVERLGYLPDMIVKDLSALGWD